MKVYYTVTSSSSFLSRYLSIHDSKLIKSEPLILQRVRKKGSIKSPSQTRKDGLPVVSPQMNFWTANPIYLIIKSRQAGPHDLVFLFNVPPSLKSSKKEYLSSFYSLPLSLFPQRKNGEKKKKKNEWRNLREGLIVLDIPGLWEPQGWSGWCPLLAWQRALSSPVGFSFAVYCV